MTLQQRAEEASARLSEKSMFFTLPALRSDFSAEIALAARKYAMKDVSYKRHIARACFVQAVAALHYAPQCTHYNHSFDIRDWPSRISVLSMLCELCGTSNTAFLHAADYMRCVCTAFKIDLDDLSFLADGEPFLFEQL